MPTLEVPVDDFVFSFPDGWMKPEKYDEWAFYKNRFQRILPSRKAIDLIAISPTHTLYLIEVKDYRNHPRTKPSELPDEIAIKVLDTLAAILPAKIHANTHEELQCARAAAKATTIRVILHLEQPRVHSKLHPQVANPANVQQKLRQLLHAVDPHTKVVSMADLQNLPWTVR